MARTSRRVNLAKSKCPVKRSRVRSEALRNLRRPKRGRATAKRFQPNPEQILSNRLRSPKPVKPFMAPDFRPKSSDVKPRLCYQIQELLYRITSDNGTTVGFIAKWSQTKETEANINAHKCFEKFIKRTKQGKRFKAKPDWYRVKMTLNKYQNGQIKVVRKASFLRNYTFQIEDIVRKEAGTDEYKLEWGLTILGQNVVATLYPEELDAFEKSNQQNLMKFELAKNRNHVNKFNDQPPIGVPINDGHDENSAESESLGENAGENSINKANIADEVGAVVDEGVGEIVGDEVSDNETEIDNEYEQIEDDIEDDGLIGQDNLADDIGNDNQIEDDHADDGLIGQDNLADNIGNDDQIEDDNADDGLIGQDYLADDIGNDDQIEDDNADDGGIEQNHAADDIGDNEQIEEENADDAGLEQNEQNNVVPEVGNNDEIAENNEHDIQIPQNEQNYVANDVEEAFPIQDGDFRVQFDNALMAVDVDAADRGNEPNVNVGAVHNLVNQNDFGHIGQIINNQIGAFEQRNINDFNRNEGINNDGRHEPQDNRNALIDPLYFPYDVVMNDAFIS